MLAALGGRVAPSGWRGGLPLTYHLGPGPAKVHMKVLSDWSQKPIYDVIAKIRGSQEPDHWIIRGNHHDGWVFGAMDPLSGQVALMAEAKAIGQLVKDGWKPRRTLIYASWDGEEPGLIGSTEWAEQHAAELKAKAVLYVNSDTNGRGFIQAEGSHALQHFLSEAARDVKDPETGARCWPGRSPKDASSNYETGTQAESARGSNGELQLGALGSGSDYTPFLQHLGVNSVNLGFEGESQYGVYHSAYDSFDHFRRFVDPTFEYGVALAKVAGRIMLRAAQAQLIPARETDFAASIAAYDDELHKLADGMRSKTRELAKLLEDDSYKLAANPDKPRTAPPRTAEVPYLNFAELDNAVAKLEQSAKASTRNMRASRPPRFRPGGAAITRVNSMLTVLEQSLDGSAGLPGREWYPAHDLCARRAYRIRREDPAGNSRGDRRAPLGRGESIHGGGLARSQRLQCPVGPRYCSAVACSAGILTAVLVVYRA